MLHSLEHTQVQERGLFHALWLNSIFRIESENRSRGVIV